MSRDKANSLSQELCIGCRSSEMHYFGSRNGYAYYLCSSCKTLQLAPQPNAAQLERAYQTDYAEAGHCQDSPELRNQAAAPQFAALCQALERNSNAFAVLDYGCGWGGVLQMLHQRGFQAEGVEFSSIMADYCESAGFTIFRCPLENIPGEKKYDAIVLSSVFEHLVEHDKWLAEARRLLVPGGLIVSLQPTAPFAVLGAHLVRLGRKTKPLPQLHQVFWPPWHTVLFSLSGMRKLMERNGFTLVQILPAPLQREHGFTGLLQRSLSLLNALATPFFGLRWPLWVGHIFVFRLHSACDSPLK